jgi:DnaJ family protein C protein 16
MDRERMNKHHVLLFHEKKSTPMMFKALSKKYRSKLEFGEIKSSEVELVKQFGVQSFSNIMVLPNPDEMAGESFVGEMKIDQLEKFLNQYAYSKPKVVKSSKFI